MVSVRNGYQICEGKADKLVRWLSGLGEWGL